MLYKKNQSETLSKELFQNPTSEYRCTPFWAWNTTLEQDHLNREIDAERQRHRSIDIKHAWANFETGDLIHRGKCRGSFREKFRTVKIHCVPPESSIIFIIITIYRSVKGFSLWCYKIFSVIMYPVYLEKQTEGRK